MERFVLSSASEVQGLGSYEKRRKVPCFLWQDVSLLKSLCMNICVVSFSSRSALHVLSLLLTDGTRLCALSAWRRGGIKDQYHNHCSEPSQTKTPVEDVARIGLVLQEKRIV